MPTPLLQHRWLRRVVKRQFGALLTPLVSQEPAAQLIRTTAREQWRLLALNLGSSVVEAFTEVATLAVIFLAVDSPTGAASGGFRWDAVPVVGSWAAGVSWLNSLPSTHVFLGLLALAVVLQALQSLMRYLN